MSRTIIAAEYLTHAQQSFLPPEQLAEFVNACSTPLRKSLRVNQLKITVKQFRQLADQYGLLLTPIPWCSDGFWITEPSTKDLPEEVTKKNLSLGNLPEHFQGLFYIQEASSMLPPMALLSEMNFSDLSNSQAPLILDMAAAPGSKTTQLASMLSNKGLILANELSASRVKVLHSNLVRCGVHNTCMTQFDGRKLGERLEGIFDFVLLDAPCGGEGTVRKDDTALKDWSLSKVQTIAKLQKELILTAYRCLKPGGRLVYSTCTLSPEENQQVAKYLLTETDAVVASLSTLFKGAEQSITKEGYLHVLPHIYDSEGFFVAAFSKPADTIVTYYSGTEKPPFDKLSKKTEQQIQKYYHEHFGLDFSEHLDNMMQRDKEIWLFPEGFKQVSQLVRFNRSGIKLAEIYPNKIRSSHEFACCFSKNIICQKLELSLSQLEDYYKGRNLSDLAVSIKNGEVLLVYKGQSVGMGTLANGRVKNGLPRDLVRDQIRFC
jgi:16S rRNA (cytosine1407-C5)-methyltransferase